MPKVVMTEKDLDSAVYDGIWFPTCPFCELVTPAEPIDYGTEGVLCEHCDRHFEVENPY